MTRYSPVRRAIGVVWSRVTGDLLRRIAPTMTNPLTRSWLPSPLALTNLARPTVPPAPGSLATCTLLAAPAATMALCMARAVWSQPPPGAAGATSLRSICATAGLASESPTARTARESNRMLGIGHLQLWTRNGCGLPS
jgi:hypothetical protein